MVQMYSQPSPVGMYLISDTQTWSGLFTVKRLRTRFGAAGSGLASTSSPLLRECVDQKEVGKETVTTLVR